MKKPHPIREWLDARNETQQSFARRAGLSEGYLSNLVLGRVKCGADSARKIVSATSGDVSFEDLLG